MVNSSGGNTTCEGKWVPTKTIAHVVFENLRFALCLVFMDTASLPPVVITNQTSYSNATRQLLISGILIVYSLEDLPGWTSSGRSYAPSEIK